MNIQKIKKLARGAGEDRGDFYAVLALYKALLEELGIDLPGRGKKR